MHACQTCSMPLNLQKDAHTIFHRQVSPTKWEVAGYACLPCERQARVDEYVRTGVIGTKVWMEAMLLDLDRERGGEPPAWATTLVGEMAEVQALMKRWEREVWFGGQEPWRDTALVEPYPGLDMLDGIVSYREGATAPEGSLQAFVLAARWHGYSATVGPLKYQSYTIAGRSVFQVQGEEDFICLILDESSPSPRGGIQGIRARSGRAMEFIQQAIEDWKAGRIALTEDENIRMF